MTTKTPVLKARAYCKKVRIPSVRVEELLKDLSSASNPEIISDDYNLLEEKTKVWIRKYKRYLRGQENYSFYEPYIGIRRYTHGDKSVLIQDMAATFFELGKHSSSKAIKKIINDANRED